MADLFSKVSELLSDPRAAQKIQQIAASLSAGDSGETSSVPEDLPPSPEGSGEGEGALSLPAGGDFLNSFSGIAHASSAHSRELALLNAVRPYLRASRADKIDRALKAIRVIDLLSNLR